MICYPLFKHFHSTSSFSMSFTSLFVCSISSVTKQVYLFLTSIRYFSDMSVLFRALTSRRGFLFVLGSVFLALFQLLQSPGNFL